jgi:hypothetical protein
MNNQDSHSHCRTDGEQVNSADRNERGEHVPNHSPLA